MALTFSTTVNDTIGGYAALTPLIQLNVAYAGSVWASYINSNANLEVQVTIAHNFSDTGDGGAATSVFMGPSGGLNVWRLGTVAEMATGVDPTGAGADVLITIDPDYINNYLFFDPAPTPSSPVPFNKVDSVQFFEHELGHAFGLSGFLTNAGTVDPGSNAVAAFDQLMQTAGGAPYYTSPSGIPYFVGPIAMAVYGGRVPLTQGNFYHVGNSAGNPGSELVTTDIMNGVQGFLGKSLHPSALDVAMLADIGVPMLNAAPVITSNGGGSTAGISLAENITAVTTVTATDANAGTVFTYSIIGGADQARFQINASSGALSFLAAPNFEAPTDSDANNSYVVLVRVNDNASASFADMQTVTVNITNASDAPQLGADSVLFAMFENGTALTTLVATDPDPGTTLTYSIVGGADQSKFQINASTGALSFVTAPHYDAPTDSDANNQYVVQVRVSDGALTDTQTIAVNIEASSGQTLLGDGVANSLFGTHGNDVLSGVDGDDTFTAFDGNDTAFGGTGNDVFLTSLGNDTAFGGTGGADLLDLSSNAGPRTINLLTGTVSGDGQVDIVAEVEYVIGTGGNDSFIGDGAGNAFYGAAGNDTLYGAAGDDSLFGGSGNDTFWGGLGQDSIDGGDGNDVVDYSTLTVALNVQLHTQLADLGSEGGFDPLLIVENVLAGSGADQIWGNHLANVIFANGNGDWLHGFGANDTLYGGDGNDQVLGGDGADTLYGGNGDDFIWFDNLDAVFGGAGIDYAYATDANAVTVNLATASLEGVWANNGADFLDASGTSWSVQLIGYGVGDTLRGGSGSDYIWFDEFDTISGGGGIDAAYATTANGVTVNYSTQGIEQVWATNGNDLLNASGTSTGAYLIAYAGTDTVLGGTGNDFMWVDWDVSDTVNGGAGRDEMYQIGVGAVSLDLGARGIEAVLGSNTNDVLNGASQTQFLVLIGLGGIDTLTGGTNNDYLYGDDGADVITGGQGNDFLFGGVGADTFVSTSVLGSSGTDQFFDFASGDKVLVSGNVVMLGLGTSTAVLTDGTTLIAANGHSWQVGDFI